MRGFRSPIESFGNSLRGLKLLVHREPHAWVHLIATACVLVTGIWVKLHRTEWLWMVAAIAWVWVAEAINTAIERACDAAHPEQHPLIRDAKDLASGAVLVAAIAAAAVGGIILVPHIWVALWGK